MTFNITFDIIVLSKLKEIRIMKKGTKVEFYVKRYRKWIKGYFMRPDEDKEGFSIILSKQWLDLYEPDAFENDIGDWSVENSLIKVSKWPD